MSLSESLFSVDEVESISADSFESRSYSSVVSFNASSTNASSLTLKQETAIDDESLATQESKDLTKFRVFLVTILFWTTIGVGLAVWIYFTEEIEKGFEEQFEEQAQELFRKSESKIIVAFGAIDSFALALSTQFSNWPFVTVNSFSIQADRLRNLSNAVAVTNYYFVEKDQIQEWEAYSIANDFWVEDGIHYQEKSPNFPKHAINATSSLSSDFRTEIEIESNSSLMVSILFKLACLQSQIAYYCFAILDSKIKFAHRELQNTLCHIFVASMATISRHQRITV